LTQSDIDPTFRVLVVDDSRAIGLAVTHSLEELPGARVDYADSLAACQRFLERQGSDYDAAVVDLNLPDAPDGQAVDIVLARGIPTIVLTGMPDLALHDRISQKSIVDYVVKQNPGAIEAVYRDVRRVLRNSRRKALVVDDSPSYRAYLRGILETQRLRVIEAGHGKEALDMLKAHGDVSLVVTDYLMPEMDGVQFTATLRHRYASSELAVIGLSGSDESFLGVRFLKAGANDLVRKPFLLEEFVGRINTCLDHLDDIQTIQDQAHRDYLTRLYNRRYLFDRGQALVRAARRARKSLLVAILDIDHFKRINDEHGHEVGDRALVALARLLQSGAREQDVVARLGGEEFCLLAAGVTDPEAMLNRLREALARLEVPVRDGVVTFTVSIGASGDLNNSLDEMLNRADKALYEAKQSGRNRVVMDSEWLDTVYDYRV